MLPDSPTLTLRPDSPTLSSTPSSASHVTVDTSASSATFFTASSHVAGCSSIWDEPSSSSSHVVDMGPEFGFEDDQLQFSVSLIALQATTAGLPPHQHSRGRTPSLSPPHTRTHALTHMPLPPSLPASLSLP